MQIKNIVEEVIAKLGLNPNNIVATEYRRRKEITLYNLIYAVLRYPSSVEEASNSLSSSKTYMLAFLKENISGKPQREQWSNWLLKTVDYKYCYQCNQYKSINSFSTRKDKKASSCKECYFTYKETNKEYFQESARIYYQNNKSTIQTKVLEHRNSNIDYYREYARNFYANNKDSGIFREYAANRRARKLHATPSWANLETIKQIYACAEGAHVDHIIPLQGELVCGLHVENNLQYLTVEENLKKSNTFIVD